MLKCTPSLPRRQLLSPMLPHHVVCCYTATACSMLGSPVVIILVDSMNDAHDMEVPPELVAQALREHLGKMTPLSEPQSHYDWALSELL